MSSAKVRGALGLALLATLIAAWLAPSAGDDVALSERTRTVTARQPATTNSTTTSSATFASAPVEVLGIRTRERDDEALRLFGSTQWTPPPPSPKVATVSAAPVVTAPVAPPLPFQVLGRYVADGRSAAFLQYNDQNLVVRVGDTIDGLYKVEGLSATTLSLRYIPLNLQQTLELGGTN